jgi:hypothetical protein
VTEPTVHRGSPFLSFDAPLPVVTDHSPDPDLIKITEIFLVPSSFLVAALGTADTNLHRAFVSLLGLVIAGLWCASTRDAAASGNDLKDRPRRTRILHRLPYVFIAGWLLSVVGHLLLWSHPLGR